MTIRVLIVDDHTVVRQGLRAFFDGDRTLELVGEAKDGAEAVRAARRLRPDVVLMDLLMPVMDGWLPPKRSARNYQRRRSWH